MALEQDLSAYLPLSGGNVSGEIQMGDNSNSRIAFGPHYMAYDSPDGIGFVSEQQGFQPRYAGLDLMRGPQYKTIAYLNDVDQALSNCLPLSGGGMTGAIGIAAGSAAGILFGSDRMWYGPGGVSLAHDS